MECRIHGDQFDIQDPDMGSARVAFQVFILEYSIPTSGCFVGSNLSQSEEGGLL